MGDHAHVCFIMKIILNLIMKWVVVDMSHTLDLFIVSIGIIEFFQLVSILTSFCILIYVLYMYAYTSYSINFNWYLFLTYIYRWFICAYYIPISWSTNFGYVKLEFFNWYLGYHYFCFPLPNFMMKNNYTSILK